MLSLFITFDATPLDPPSINEFSWGFHKLDEMAMIPILEPEALLCENKKKFSDKMLPAVRIEPSPLMNLYEIVIDINREFYS